MGQFELLEMTEWFEFKFENGGILKSVNTTLIIPFHTLRLLGGLFLALPCLLDPPSPFGDLLLSLHQFSGLLIGVSYGCGLPMLLWFLDSLKNGDTSWPHICICLLPNSVLVA